MLNATLPRAVTAGLAAVESIVKERQISGYHGPVVDNFTLKHSAFQTSVEVAAGNSLFHVIVDNERVAADLMQELEKRRAGRLTFLPLNRLQVERVQYPASSDVKAMVEEAIAFDQAFEVAMRHVSICILNIYAGVMFGFRYSGKSCLPEIWMLLLDLAENVSWTASLLRAMSSTERVVTKAVFTMIGCLGFLQFIRFALQQLILLVCLLRRTA
jgi:hypothetical protein